MALSRFSPTGKNRNGATWLNLVQTDLGCLTVNVIGPQILPKELHAST